MAATDGQLDAVAVYLGEELDLKAASASYGARAGGTDPVFVPVGQGRAALFRYGVVVFLGADADERRTALTALEPHVLGRFSAYEVEEATILIEPESEEHRGRDGVILLRRIDHGRLSVVSEALAKSTALAHYEREVGGLIDLVEPLTRSLREGHRPIRGHRRLVTQLGSALLTQARVMGRHEVIEKPEVTWDQPELDRLFTRMSAEYELEERARILSAKAEFVSGSIQLLIDMDRHRQSIRVEWYIVLLIVLEIVILVFEMFVLR